MFNPPRKYSEYIQDVPKSIDWILKKIYPPNYGSFYDTTTQYVSAPNTPTYWNIDTMVEARGIYIESLNKIVVSSSGVYNFQFSAQLDKIGGGKQYADIWIMKNGVNVTESNTKVLLSGNNDKAVAAWNFVLSMNSGDYLQFVFSSPDATTHLTYIPAAPPIPSTPSLILTVTEVK